MTGLPAILRVQVLSCCDLPAGDINGKSDPYVNIRFSAQSKKTPVISKTLDPVYDNDAKFDIYISEDDVKDNGALLHFTVMDHDRFTRDDFLAGCSLLPSEWFRGVDTANNLPEYGFHDPGNKPASFTLYANNPNSSPTIQLKIGLMATDPQRGPQEMSIKESMIRAVSSLEAIVHDKAEKDKSIRDQTPARASRPPRAFKG